MDSVEEAQPEIANDAFSSLLVALQGVRILEKPRVSREVIIFVLKEHTEMMREFKQELTNFSAVAKELTAQQESNNRAINALTKDMKENKEMVDQIDSRVVSMQEDLAVVQSKISEFEVIKQVLREHKGEINDIDTRLRLTTSELKQSTESTGRALHALEVKSNETQFSLKELQHRVDHFGDNLTLSSNQIVVESSVGFS